MYYDAYNETNAYAAFAQGTYQLTDKLSFTAGLRYSYEEKDAEIASLIDNQNSPCNIVEGPDCPYDFVDDDDWSNVAPKLGATYNLDKQSRISIAYTHAFDNAIEGTSTFTGPQTGHVRMHQNMLQISYSRDLGGK